ncbi:hypothetical protein SESBI_06616 [Sesbania bispinosa]|nr:hypothetical protein SESBI_06616 [Sesbania bispinosa]
MAGTKSKTTPSPNNTTPTFTWGRTKSNALGSNGTQNLGIGFLGQNERKENGEGEHGILSN